VEDLGSFRAAGRTLLSLGLVKGTEGNLSVYDGSTLAITRTGSVLARLVEGDLVSGVLDGELPQASSDLEVHRALYRANGPGSVVHAHPPGTVPQGAATPGEHGVYVFGPTLEDAVDAAVRGAREPAR
jgi:ribulose-5-phosphate 4-epimerase/fuculose-1-phosphate aldolase